MTAGLRADTATRRDAPGPRGAARGIARRLAVHGWWIIPLLIASVLAAAQWVPPTGAYRLRMPELAWCDGSTMPAPRFARSLLDADVQCLVVEYRPVLAVDAAALRGYAVLIEGAHQDVAVDVNGVRVRDLAPLDRRSHRMAPILVQVGSGLLRTGENVVRLELHTSGRFGAPALLRRALLGPAEPIEAWHRRHLLLQEGGARLTLVAAASLLLLLLPIAVAGPANPALRWYALAMVLAAVYVSTFASSWRPLPHTPWGVIVMVALAVSLAAFIRMSEIELGQPRRRYPFTLCLVAALLWLAAPWMPQLGLWQAVDGAARLILLFLLLDLGRHWWRGRHARLVPDPRWSVGGVGLLLVLGITDSLETLLRQHWPAIAYLLHWGILYLLGLMFIALILRLLGALRDAEHSQQRLATALAERTQELTAEFALRRAAESARTLAEERQRIMRDMHDGVGGQLVALMTQVRSGATDPAALATELRRTLDDLRLMIDSLDPACADLSVALGMLRRRCEGLSGVDGPTVAWRTAHLPDLPALPPATVLHVLRIVQEALANALKHAGARRITVQADWDGATVRIAVVDDGCGGVREGAGRGIANLRERAAAIGARLEIASGEGGSRIDITLPLAMPGGPDGAPPASG